MQLKAVQSKYSLFKKNIYILGGLCSETCDLFNHVLSLVIIGKIISLGTITFLQDCADWVEIYCSIIMKQLFYNVTFKCPLVNIC